MAFSFLLEFLLSVVSPFVLWVISRWDNISAKIPLTSDAFPYYWDSRFFLENISNGVYPLWNPVYSFGVPWGFFLRRMGEINPFFWIIPFLRTFGVPAFFAHMAFLLMYYFLGILGYWLLARVIFKDRILSGIACLLLLFTWGGQLFYCFELLIFVPLIWFFYFLIAFSIEKKIHQFLGISFSLGILLATYIPFFAATVISCILLFISIFFFKETIEFLKGSALFIRHHKFVGFLFCGFILLATSYAINFYLDSKDNSFVLPSRHQETSSHSELSIPVKEKEGGGTSTSVTWDIISHGYFYKVFSDQKSLTIGDFNIAYFFFIVFIVAAVNPISKRSVFLFSTALFIALIAMTKSGRVYPFLLDHIFFFRYMRMMHLFLWLAVVPLAIFLIIEQLQAFLSNYKASKNLKVLAFVVVVHAVFFLWLLTQHGILFVSFMAVIASLAFFSFTIWGGVNFTLLTIILSLSIIIQYFGTSFYINKNSPHQELSKSHKGLDSHGKFPFLLLDKVALKPSVKKGGMQGDILQMGAVVGYYENPWIRNLRQLVHPDILNSFMANNLILYDNTFPADDSASLNFYAKLDDLWRTHKNIVLLPKKDSIPEDFKYSPHKPLKAEVVLKTNTHVKVLSHDVNTLKLKTSLDQARFLLWTNGYHHNWHVYIDGRKARLLRADFAFKGVWVPAGEHTIVFRFMTPWRYFLAYLGLFLTASLLVFIFIRGIKEKFLIGKDVSRGY